MLKNNNKGFSLPEIMIASFVVIVGVLASYMVVQNIFADTFTASSMLTAAYLAEEGIEIVRNIRDSNWVDGDTWDDKLATGATTCNPSTHHCQVSYEKEDLDSIPIGTGLEPLEFNGSYYGDDIGGTNTIFTREITIIKEDPGGVDERLKVTSEVTWQESGLTRGVTAISYLYEWK